MLHGCGWVRGRRVERVGQLRPAPASVQAPASVPADEAPALGAKIARLFERYQDDLFEYLHFFAVLKLIVVMLYVGHLFGCFFHYFSVDEWRTDDELAQIDAGTLSLWLKEYFDDSHHASGDVWDRYIASMYWAFTTMTTVGYGDISSVTRSERIIACFGMLVGGFVFLGVIGTIGDVVAARDLSKKAHAQKMEAVAAFIRDNQLPQEYYKEVLGFFRKQHVVGYDRRALLNDMPYWLRKKIMFYTYKAVIEKTPCLTSTTASTRTCSSPSSSRGCAKVSYPSGQIIYQRGEIARHMFILTAGTVEVLDKTHAFALTMLAPGCDVEFGEGCVLGDVRRRENARAMGHVDVCQLVSHELDDLLDTYPHLHRALRSAYFKRKALLARFEAARAANGEALAPAVRADGRCAGGWTGGRRSALRRLDGRGRAGWGSRPFKKTTRPRARRRRDRGRTPWVSRRRRLMERRRIFGRRRLTTQLETGGSRRPDAGV